MMKLIALLPLVALAGCAENFSWYDSGTWHFRMAEKQKIRHIYERACVDGLTQEDRRLLLMNGVSGAALQTNCLPYTDRPLPPQRFEGR